MWDAGLWSLSHYRVKQCVAHFVTCWIYVTLILLTIVNTQTSAAAALGIIILVHWANWDSSQLMITEKMLCVFVMMLLPLLQGSPETRCLGWSELVPYL